MNDFFYALTACSVLTAAIYHNPPTDTTTHRPSLKLSIDADNIIDTVNPMLMGFNTIYCHEKDTLWERGTGVIPTLLRSIDTRILRYPGGTVTTFYHWESPTGQGWEDSWSDHFNATNNSPPTEWMDIDEYLAVTDKIQAEPLVGINIGSGKKHNRVNDGIEEAVKLVRYNLEKGNRVSYYYLDNEPYHATANYTFTAEEYAEQINLYAEAMKKINPKIHIIVNTHPNNTEYTRTLLEQAGKNINLVDIHFYWRFQNATFERWKSEIEMTHTNRLPYRVQRAKFRELSTAVGYPDIDLISLEWNIGPPGRGNTPPSGVESALMVSEQYIQFIQSGMPMACFWPIFWPTGTEWTSRMLVNPIRDFARNPVYDMFGLFTDAMGQQLVETGASVEGLVNVAVKSTDGRTLWVYLVNKRPSASPVDIDILLDGFESANYTVQRVECTDGEADRLHINDGQLITAGPSLFRLRTPAFSFTKITFEK